MAARKGVGCMLLKLINTLLLMAIGAAMMYNAMMTSENQQEVKMSEGSVVRVKRSVSRRETQGGVVYTQWGRQNCTGLDADTVYTGVAGGSHYTQTGGGSNHLCLPLEPIWGNFIPAQVSHALIYGAEYQIEGGKNIPFYGQHEVLHDHNIPCAVCHVATRSTQMMIPARNLCFGDWKEEYHGYLMAEHHTHKGRSQFTCVDHNPDIDAAGFRNEDGALFYTTEGVCGSLPCPPYENGKELTCVVCTK